MRTPATQQTECSSASEPDGGAGASGAEKNGCTRRRTGAPRLRCAAMSRMAPSLWQTGSTRACTTGAVTNPKPARPPRGHDPPLGLQPKFSWRGMTTGRHPDANRSLTALWCRPSLPFDCGFAGLGMRGPSDHPIAERNRVWLATARRNRLPNCPHRVKATRGASRERTPPAATE